MKGFICVSILFVFSLGLISTTATTEWDYTHPELWVDYNLLCGGSYQSPFALETDKMMSGENANFEVHYAPWTDATVGNTHHNTMQVTAPNDSTSYVNFFGKKYKLLQFHYHWLSEHVIDSKHSDMEMHLVHQADDGSLLAVGILMKISTDPSSFLAKFWGKCPLTAGSSASLAGISIDPSEYFPSVSDYIYYEGSTTTPNCTAAQWFLFTEPNTVSQEQVDSFKNILVNTLREGATTNVRPLQAADNRRVWRYQKPSSPKVDDDDDDDNDVTFKPGIFALMIILIVVGTFVIGSFVGCLIGSKRKRESLESPHGLDYVDFESSASTPLTR